MGEIPVLEGDGQRLTQTAPILLRLAERYERFAPADETERFEVLRWLFFDNQKLSGSMASYRFRRAFTPDSDPAVQAYLRRNVDSALEIVDSKLTRRPFIAGNRPTVADPSMCGYLMFPPDESGYDLAGRFPGIGARLGRITELPGWKAPYELLSGQRLRKYV